MHERIVQIIGRCRLTCEAAGWRRVSGGTEILGRNGSAALDTPPEAAAAFYKAEWA
jgi:hypothetical protein